MSEKKNIIKRIFTNIYVKNIFIMLVVSLALVLILLLALNIYTRHNESITVPNVKGLQAEDARGIITSADLNYEIIDSIFQVGGTPGAVLEQIPKGDSKVKSGRTVYLTIQAKGVQMVPVPELKDFSRRQAEAQLKSLGFEKIIIDEVPSPYAGIVISVSYKGKILSPNQKVPKGSMLKLTIGAGGEPLEDDSLPYTEPKVDESFFE
ncbi:PASTA domain-containing protein [Dysgonomonas sp. 511]|uniref:PASTA domain-containing protein n=1 Tax=Dysgonomonas sp. 511 TaxID=2302930 RepID=UPI0013D25428|nr:PASTA domain-containing protein [Dysgonomonas sp. 511]NDV77642.1 PASTA domain-containing protein [Dysgonomonas sp. 511]